MLLDIGSTTSDLIPLLDGVPCAKGRTDRERLRNWELIYRGVRRTPLYGVGGGFVCAELFATTADVFLVLGLLPEDPADTDTANGRPFTRDHSLTRLARMFGADREEMSDDDLRAYAAEVHRDMCGMIGCGLNLFWGGRFEYRPDLTVIVSGTGAFLAPGILEKAVPNFPEPLPQPRVVSLNDALGPAVSACAPAYAVAVLASGI